MSIAPEVPERVTEPAVGGTRRNSGGRAVQISRFRPRLEKPRRSKA